MVEGSGKCTGLSSSISVPLVNLTLYRTVGAVRTRERSNSLSSLSWTTSRWRSPRNPQRKPNPSPAELTFSKTREASLSFSFSIAVARSV